MEGYQRRRLFFWQKTLITNTTGIGVGSLIPVSTIIKATPPAQMGELEKDWHT